MREKWPLPRALLMIFLITIGISGIATLSVLYYKQLRIKRATQSKYMISWLQQRGPSAGALSSDHLAELLNLSVDQPTNYYLFSEKDGTERLRAHPLFKEATVSKIRPDQVLVDYQLRKPVASVAGVSDTALDEEGMVIPLMEDQRLPQINMGCSLKWGDRWRGKKKRLCFELLAVLADEDVVFLDVSLAQHKSRGRREVVVELEEMGKRRILRLSPQGYREELKNYFALREIEGEELRDKDYRIDLRLNQIGLIQPL